MKFLKSFNENSVQDEIISEIETIRYIVEDEYLPLYIKPHSNDFIAISINLPVKNYISLNGISPVEEFEDRLEEICLKNKYYCRKIKNTNKHGYAIWHCYNDKFKNDNISRWREDIYED